MWCQNVRERTIRYSGRGGLGRGFAVFDPGVGGGNLPSGGKGGVVFALEFEFVFAFLSSLGVAE